MEYRSRAILAPRVSAPEFCLIILYSWTSRFVYLLRTVASHLLSSLHPLSLNLDTVRIDLAWDGARPAGTCAPPGGPLLVRAAPCGASDKP